MRRRNTAVIAAVAVVALAAVAFAAQVGAAPSASSAAAEELLVHAPRRRCAPVHRRPRSLWREYRPRRQGGHRLAERRPEEGRPRQEDPGQARRIGGRPDPGERLRRSRDEARQVEQGERADRRDGVERDDPDGAVRRDPEPHRADLADVERAADDDDRRQRLPLADLPVRHAAGQGACAGRDQGVRQRCDAEHRCAERRLRHRAQAAVRHRVPAARRQDRRQRVVEPRPADVRHRGAEARRRKPGRLRDHRLPRDVREVRARARTDRQVGREQDVHDRGAPQHGRARQDRQPRRRPPRHRRERRRRPGRRVVRRLLEDRT